MMEYIVLDMIDYKEYWKTIYKYCLLHRLRDELGNYNHEEIQQILYNYEHSYTYVHGGSLIYVLELVKKEGKDNAMSW